MITLKKLENNLWIRPKSWGLFYIELYYCNQVYSCTSNNTLAVDRIKAKYETAEKSALFGYTLKQAYLSLYDECKEKNNL